jgi:hypothetical protein
VGRRSHQVSMEQGAWSREPDKSKEHGARSVEQEGGGEHEAGRSEHGAGSEEHGATRKRRITEARVTSTKRWTRRDGERSRKKSSHFAKASGARS